MRRSTPSADRTAACQGRRRRSNDRVIASATGRSWPGAASCAGHICCGLARPRIRHPLQTLAPARFLRRLPQVQGSSQSSSQPALYRRLLARSSRDVFNEMQSRHRHNVGQTRDRQSTPWCRRSQHRRNQPPTTFWKLRARHVRRRSHLSSSCYCSDWVPQATVHLARRKGRRRDR